MNLRFKLATEPLEKASMETFFVERRKNGGRGGFSANPNPSFVLKPK